MTDHRTVERVLMAGVFLYLAATLAVSAYLAHGPDDSVLRRALEPRPCAMRVLTGIPCPLCYGTTTYILIWRGRWAPALRANPFVFGLFWLSAAGLVVIAGLFVSRQPLRRWTGRLSPRGWLLVALGLALLLMVNWVYLVVAHRGISPEAILSQAP